jgi:hypothetical protein
MIMIITGDKEATAGSLIVAVALVYLADKHALQPVRSHNERVPARISAFFQSVKMTRCLHREVVALERLEGGGQSRAGEESGDIASAQKKSKHNACDKDGCKPGIRVRLGQRRLKVGDKDVG